MFGCKQPRRQQEGVGGDGSTAQPLCSFWQPSCLSKVSVRMERQEEWVGCWPCSLPSHSGLDSCSDPVVVSAGKHCFVHVHLHTCLGIFSTPFQPASDPGWKAIGLAPYTLTTGHCWVSLQPSVFLDLLQWLLSSGGHFPFQPGLSHSYHPSLSQVHPSIAPGVGAGVRSRARLSAPLSTYPGIRSDTGSWSCL